VNGAGGAGPASTCRHVGAVFALSLSLSKYQSGELDRSGAISRCGDGMMRVMLYKAAHFMLVRSRLDAW
jgi:transposase